MIRITRLDHVVIRVDDLARMRRFYCEVLGCREERVVDALGLVQLRAGESLIDLVDAAGELGRRGGAPPGDAGRNMEHLCLRVDPFEELALRAHLDSFGVTAGATERRYGADGFGPSIYLDDPEGNRLELKGPPEGQPGDVPA